MTSMSPVIMTKLGVRVVNVNSWLSGCGLMRWSVVELNFASPAQSAEITESESFDA